MTKQEIRKKILAKRNRLPKNWVTNKSKIIHKRLIATKEFRRAKTIMFYIATDNEVETKSSVELALRQKKQICAPCTDRINNRLHPAIIENLKTDLKEGCYGILQPPKNTVSSPKKIDLIITPGIAFDLNGSRLGRGMAYYDRFLKNMGNIPKIGLAFDFQIIGQLPVDTHDIAMNKVITEKRIISKTKPRIYSTE